MKKDLVRITIMTISEILLNDDKIIEQLLLSNDFTLKILLDIYIELSNLSIYKIQKEIENSTFFSKIAYEHKSKLLNKKHYLLMNIKTLISTEL